MISAAELASMQATANASLDQSITIKRATRTADATGHYSDTWNTIATVNGNVAKPSGTLEQSYDYLIGALDDWQIRVPVGTNLLPDDRVVVGSQTMRVMVLLQPQSYQTSMLAIAVEITGEAI